MQIKLLFAKEKKDSKVTQKVTHDAVAGCRVPRNVETEQAGYTLTKK